MHLTDKKLTTLAIIYIYIYIYVSYIYQPSDRGGSSLVRHVKYLAFLHRIFYVEKNVGLLKWSFSTSTFTKHLTLFHFISSLLRTAFSLYMFSVYSTAGTVARK